MLGRPFGPVLSLETAPCNILTHCVQRKNSKLLEDREYFWNLLMSFWAKDKVDQWKYAAFGDPDALHGDETE